MSSVFYWTGVLVWYTAASYGLAYGLHRAAARIVYHADWAVDLAEFWAWKRDVKGKKP